MKKIAIFFILILLSGVVFARELQGIISNKRGLVMQSLDDGALGYICPKYSVCKDDCRTGQFVYFDFNFDFVDNQMFSIPKDYCFYANGVYKYFNKDGVQKTVRRVGLISK